MFGFAMRTTTREGVQLRLRPYTEEEMEQVTGHLTSYETTKTITLRGAPTVEQEREWLKKTAEDENGRLWAIAVVQDDGSELPIGHTTLNRGKNGRWTSGSLIFRREWWGRGVISAAHRARCLYATRVEQILFIDSGALQGNPASFKALRRVGYEQCGITYRCAVIDGVCRHADDLLWVNPTEPSWTYFWEAQDPPSKFVRARKRALKALEAAEKEVSFE